jgi:Dolichyl-phosphate-mannose-protein mannosyltransferase
VLSEHSGLTLLCAITAIALVVLAASGSLLGHDEAAYAVGGRMLVEGHSGYWPHRSVGMQAIAALPVLLGGGDLVMRTPPVLFSLALLVTVWWAVRRAYDATTALWTAALTASSFTVAWRGFKLETDILAAALVIACAGLLLTRLAEDRRRWSLVWIGPLAASAYYVRYGAAPILLSLALAAAIAFHDRLRTHALPLAAAAAAFGACLVPHFLHSIELGGDPLWIARTAKEVAGHRYLGEGLVYYASRWWIQIGFVTIAIAGGVLAIATRRAPISRATVFFGLAGAASLVALGLTAHGEARYGLVPQILLTAVGVAAIRASGAWSRRGRRVALAGLVVAWGIAMVISYRLVTSHARAASAVVPAGALIRRDARGAPCFIEAPRSPQSAWYSGCQPITDWGEVPDERYIVWVNRESTDPEVQAMIRQHGDRLRSVGRVAAGSETAIVYHLRRRP